LLKRAIEAKEEEIGFSYSAFYISKSVLLYLTIVGLKLHGGGCEIFAKRNQFTNSAD
jgi:hypothetical protein